jgi:hypothetical protein
VAVRNPATSVVVVDHEFQRVLTDTGHLQETDAPGVYKVRTQFGRDLTTASEEIVCLDRDLAIGTDAPTLLSPAPLPGGPRSDDRHRELFVAAAAYGAQDGAATSAVTVMARYSTGPRAGEPVPDLPHPLAGLQLVDPAGHVVADLTEGCSESTDQGDPVAVWERAVEPGVYALRQALPRGTYEGSLVVSAGWLTQLVVRRTTGLGGAWLDERAGGGVVEPDDLALFMRRTASGAVPERDEVVEAARLALVQGRDLLGEGQGRELRRVLLEEYDDPVAGIIGCHLLLRAMAGPADTESDRDRVFDRAIVRLRGLVPGGHPDVEALSLRCSDPALRLAGPLPAPPVFTDSWQLVVTASYDRPDLVPPEMWDRVHASTRLGPFLVWAADEATRAVHARQLAEWIAGADVGGAAPPAEGGPRAAAAAVPGPRAAPGPVPETVRDAARRLGIPATATVGLWEGRTASP